MNNSKKYVGPVTVRALIELVVNEIEGVESNLTKALEAVVNRADIVTDLAGYLPPGEGEDPDNKVAAAAVVKELQEAVNRLTGGGDGAGGGAAITTADIINTWEGYDVDADADKVVAAALVKAIKDQVDALSTTIQEELEGKKGQPGGIASLDEAGKVPAEQLPSYVDDVIEGFMTETVTGEGDAAVTTRTFFEPNEDETAASTTQIVGEKGKIYVDLNTSYTYRWSGSTYVRVNEIDLVELTPEDVENMWNEVAAEFQDIETA